MERLIYLLKSIAEISTHTKAIFVAFVGCVVAFYQCENSRPHDYNPDPIPINGKIDISGMWYNAETGGVSQFVQNGTIITFENFNALGQRVGYGNGTILNNRLELSGVENSQGYDSNYSVKFYLSNYNQRLSGTITSSISGLSFPLNLIKR